MARGRRACAGHVEATNGNAVAESRILPWHRRSSYEPDAPARGVPQSPRWRVGLVCAKDAKLSCRGNTSDGTIVPQTDRVAYKRFDFPTSFGGRAKAPRAALLH